MAAMKRLMAAGIIFGVAASWVLAITVRLTTGAWYMPDMWVWFGTFADGGIVEFHWYLPSIAFFHFA